MRDLDRLRRPGGPGRELHEGQIILADLDGVDRVVRNFGGQGLDLGQNVVQLVQNRIDLWRV
nr:hypothetical protein [Mycobacterium riyadhense]